MEYQDFLESKKIEYQPSGIEVGIDDLSPQMFDFQKAITRWCLMKGKSAVFAGCGLGKTIISLEWSKHLITLDKNILILAPLAVTYQTVEEGKKFNIKVNICESQKDVKKGINITNYEKLQKFDCLFFEGIVIDESSCLKDFTSKNRNTIIESFQNTPFKLACTATPSPNDFMEMGNHSEFLNIMGYNEMLSMFFVHDGGETSKWRLKKHAEKSFWQWVSSWAVMMQKPSDLGFEDSGYILPPLRLHQITVKKNKAKKGQLYAVNAFTLKEQLRARRESINERVSACAEMINKSDDYFSVWCNLNDESVLLGKLINNSIEIKGSDKPKVKEEALLNFAHGKIKRLITKSSIAGFGMNFQKCHKTCFVGVNHSFEKFYQTIRRHWRFGQAEPVDVYIFTAEEEGEIIKNIQRKERDFEKMQGGMISATQEINKMNISIHEPIKNNVIKNKATGRGWELYRGDSVQVLKKLKNDSVGFIIYSPPFENLYVYSDHIEDMGNSKNTWEFFRHFSFLVNELYRVLAPGRLMAVHCTDIPSMKQRDGVIGLKDFPGQLIRCFLRHKFIYHSKITIWKCPVVEMTRTKALGLLHKQIKKDSSMCRVGIPDYMVIVRKDGENQNRITHTNKTFPVDLWQKYASPVWFDIKQGDTLQKQSARDNNDERHVCPLQLGVIDRCLDLWSNTGDIVLDPFSGIGSSGYQSIKKGRKYIGTELKESYFKASVTNLKSAELSNRQLTLF